MKIISRKKAKERGLNRYFTGKPCKRGHVVARYTSNCKCPLCHQQTRKESDIKYFLSHSVEIIQKQRKFRKENPDSRKEETRKYYTKNKTKICTKAREWAVDNKEKMKRIHKRWRSKNPDKLAIAHNRYLSVRNRAIPAWAETELIKKVYLMRDILNELWNTNFHVDHIIPLQGKNVCGLHCWNNLQLLDAKLNSSKGNR